MCELIYCVYANVHTYYITTKFFQDFFCFFQKKTSYHHAASSDTAICLKAIPLLKKGIFVTKIMYEDTQAT